MVQIVPFIFGKVAGSYPAVGTRKLINNNVVYENRRVDYQIFSIGFHVYT